MIVGFAHLNNAQKSPQMLTSSRTIGISKRQIDVLQRTPAKLFAGNG